MDCEISAVDSLFVIHISLFRDRPRLENQLIWTDRRTVTTVGVTNHTKTIAGPRPQLSAFGRQTEAVKDRGLYSSSIVHQLSRTKHVHTKGVIDDSIHFGTSQALSKEQDLTE